MLRRIGVIALLTILGAAAVLQAPAQEGVGERIGEKLDRGFSQLKSELREEWAQMKKSVEKMGVHGRVYSRLRWDKAIQGTKIEIEVSDKGIVVLQGEVPSQAAHTKAVQLAQDTVGVNEVIDELKVIAPLE